MASIRKRADGAWRARYRDEAGREHARHFARKVDAQRWVDEVTASVVTGTYVDPKAGRVTFDGFARTWSSRQVWEASTERSVDLVYRSVPFAGVPLAQLRPSHVEAWVKAMASHGLAPSTIASRMNTVRAVFKAAVRDRVIAVDPTQGVALPRRRRAEHAMVIPSPADVGAILAAAEDYQQPIWALAAFAGLRLGEASAVQVADIDFLRRRLMVQRQVQRGQKGAGLELRPPKYGSERLVYLPDGLLAMLSQHLETFGIGTGGWLIPTPSGGPVPPSTANGWWATTTTRARVRVNLHSLRHFYASGLIAAGCDVVTVQRALGHSSPSTTLNTYSHLWPNAEDRTRAASSMLFEAAVAADHPTNKDGPLARAVGPSPRGGGGVWPST